MITRLETIYTGGGIYIYAGKLSSGKYFLTDDDFMECVHILDADPYKDLDLVDSDWIEKHTLEVLTDSDAYNFWKDMLRKACDLSDMLETDRDLRLEWLLTH